MSNQLAANPWKLDTPATIIKYQIKVRNFEFLGYSVATDEVVLQDINGNNVWDTRGSTDFSIQRSGSVGWINGLIFASITAGSTGFVKVYLE